MTAEFLRYPLLTPVADVEDEKCSDPALVVFDHATVDPSYEFYTVQRVDGHLSLRDSSQIRRIEPIQFLVKWAKGVSYGEKS